MSKVNYRRCDICGEILKTDIRISGFTNGYRIWNRLFNKLDICNTCMKKIKQLSIDSKEEENMLKNCLINIINMKILIWNQHICKVLKICLIYSAIKD